MQQEGEIIYPNLKRLTFKKLKTKGIYLLDTSIQKYLYIGSDANIEIVREIITPEQMQSKMESIVCITLAICMIINLDLPLSY